jgi:hypothetical protein
MRRCPRSSKRDRAEIQHLEREIGRLTEAIASGGPLASVFAALQVRQGRRDELAAAVAVREAADIGRFNRQAVEHDVRRHLENWRALLTKHVNDGRQLLREVLSGPLKFTPEGRTYRFGGEASFSRLLSGVAGVATFVVRPEGLEPPAYRFEACRSIQLSYGRV